VYAPRLKPNTAIRSPGLVPRRQPVVGVHDIAGQPGARTAAQQPVQQRTGRADPRLVVRQLRAALLIPVSQGIGDAPDIGDGRILGRVPRAVATHDETSHCCTVTACPLPDSPLAKRAALTAVLTLTARTPGSSGTWFVDARTWRRREQRRPARPGRTTYQSIVDGPRRGGAIFAVELDPVRCGQVHWAVARQRRRPDFPDPAREQRSAFCTIVHHEGRTARASCGQRPSTTIGYRQRHERGSLDSGSGLRQVPRA